MSEAAEFPSGGDVAEWVRWGETKISLSLAVSLYFKLPRSAFVDGLLECYQQYLDLCEPQLRWYGSETSGRYREVDKKVLRIPFRRVPEVVQNGKFWAWMVYAGEHHRHAAPYQFEGMLAEEGEGSLTGHMRAAFPVKMFREDLGRFVELVKALAARAPFFFGYGGFSFSEAIEISTRQQNENYLLPSAMRFSGVEVESRDRTCICCMDTIKGVNWLTLLSPPFVERLGGRAALRAQLSEAIMLHDLPSGLMIQAGPAPGLGDVNAGERLPLYREVHRVLKPVRVVDHWLLGDRVFKTDETRRWMSRFDD